MRDRGVVDGDTLAWIEGGPNDWLPLAEIDSGIVGLAVTPPALPAPVAFVAGIVAVPLVAWAADAIALNVSGQSIPQLWTLGGSAVAYWMLCSLDVAALKKAGRLRQDSPIVWGFLLLPIYLILRARIARTSWLWVFAWIAAAGAPLAVLAIQTNGNLYWGSGIPDCSSGFAKGQASRLFDEIPLAKLTGSRAVTIDGIQEVSFANQLRTCRAAVSTSLGRVVNIEFTLEQRDQQIWTNVNIQTD